MFHFLSAIRWRGNKLEGGECISAIVYGSCYLAILNHTLLPRVINISISPLSKRKERRGRRILFYRKRNRALETYPGLQ